MDLTTNGVVITDAIKYVQTNKEKLTMSTKEDKESKEPDYDDDKDQLEEVQEEEAEELKGGNNESCFLKLSIGFLQNISQYSTLYRKPRCIHISRTRKAQRF